MINPIFESSARRRMRTDKTPMIWTAWVLALLLFSVFGLSDFMGRGVRMDQMRRSTEWYIWLTAMQLALVVLVSPALSAVSIAGERERQTFDLLLVTGVGVRRIVLGKMMENFAFLALLIVSGAPVMVLAYMAAGVPVWQLMMTLAWLLLVAAEALAVGMAASVICGRTLTSIITSYLAVVTLGGLSWLLAKHGPFAANYTYSSIAALEDMSTARILLGMPVPIFFNPAVGVVTLLAHQTGILHNTMQNTMRLFDIYSAAKAAGFGAVSGVCYCASLVSTALLTILSILILHLKTGAYTKK